MKFNMNKKIWIVIIVIIVLIIGGFLFFYIKNHSNTQNNSGNYEVNRTSATSNVNNNSNNETINNSTKETNNSQANETTPAPSTEVPVQPDPQPAPQPVEETIATFSTKIYSSDSARQNNISITCKTLDGTTVDNGATFSFCNTVGPSTTAKGYQKADIFDNNGNKKKGLGGGNCQISTTLYNAVLAVPSLVVTERHEHSNYVPYIQKGKDAAVAYGSYDLKFRNNTGYTLKINTSSSAKSVDISLVLIK